MNVNEMSELAAEARAKVNASGIGSMHPAWDIVFDAEAFIAGRPTLLSGTRENVYPQLIQMLRQFLDR